MNQENSNGFKKSFYVFLTSIMGVFLFFVLHRLAFFFWSVISVISETMARNYYSLPVLVFEYVSLILALLGGAWYGIWLGIFWYDKVYVENSRRGFIERISDKIWPAPKIHTGTTGKLLAVTRKLEEDLLNLEDLAAQKPAPEISAPKAIKRTIVRKSAPKNLNKLK